MRLGACVGSQGLLTLGLKKRAARVFNESGMAIAWLLTLAHVGYNAGAL